MPDSRAVVLLFYAFLLSLGESGLGTQLIAHLISYFKAMLKHLHWSRTDNQQQARFMPD